MTRVDSDLSTSKGQGRLPGGKSRTEIVREAKARYRAKLKREGKIMVTFPISEETNKRIKEEAQSYGKTATALMTELLEDVANRNPLSRFAADLTSGNDFTREREKLYQRFTEELVVNPLLTRKLVSFQASKTTPFYRWLKYKEAFSPELVDYLYDLVDTGSGYKPHVLDPFAGTGTALTRACARGWKATGIELLPVGALALEARLLSDSVNIKQFFDALNTLKQHDWGKSGATYRFPHLRITESAFSRETETHMASFVRFLNEMKNKTLRFIFHFACLSILEEVSFTRKDGQYLRWDYRSGRKLAKRFNKGEIPPFPKAILDRLEQIGQDLEQRNGRIFSEQANIIKGSCLFELPKLPSGEFDLVLTSPPYCNRYDYTRTYALELAFCGLGEEDIKDLRQTLLSATVENKSKRKKLQSFYAKAEKPNMYHAIESAFNQEGALHEVLDLLWEAREKGELSNNNVPHLVKNYFFEMAQVIFELARLLKPGGRIFMVNDNVRYHGQEVPVDLILSAYAEKAGLMVEKIWILPKGKGNSSQQMGKWGRVELRKCIYSWRKP